RRAKSKVSKPKLTLTRRRHGLPKCARDSTELKRAPPRPFHGPRRDGAFTRRPDVARELEDLEEALDEAEAAARWYAERSAAAAVAFSEEWTRPNPQLLAFQSA